MRNSSTSAIPHETPENLFKGSISDQKKYFEGLFESFEEIFFHGEDFPLKRETYFIKCKQIMKQSNVERDTLSFERVSSSILLFLVVNCQRNIGPKLEELLQNDAAKLFDFLSRYSFSIKDIEQNILLSLKQKDRIFIESGSRRLVNKIRHEIPLAMKNLIDADLGYFTRPDGSQVTFEQYAELVDENVDVLHAQLDDAKDLFVAKFKRKGEAV